MSDDDRLDVEVVLLDLAARTKAEVLQRLAEQAGAVLGSAAAEISRALADRERLGSTGVGSEVALPHADVPGLARALTLFARPARPVEWDAIDDRPVGLIVAVLSPPLAERAPSTHLARLARLLRRADVRDRLTACSSDEEVRRIFADAG